MRCIGGFPNKDATTCRAQEYIENENSRLQRENQFWAKEIIVKIEYKYCPNLTIIDTPGDAPASAATEPEHEAYT